MFTNLDFYVYNNKKSTGYEQIKRQKHNYGHI